MKYVLLLSILILFTQFSLYGQNKRLSKPESYGMSSERLIRTSDLLDKATQKGQIGAVVGLIARKGKIIFLKGSGKLGDGVPMPTNAIVRGASIGKTITAVAILRLNEQGLIQLTDRVSRYFPQYSKLKVRIDGNNAKSKTIDAKSHMTILHLLTHKSGISGDGKAFNKVWEKAKNVRQFARMTAKIPLEFDPGKKFSYGSMGSSYEILAAIVEVVSGKNFKEFLREEILNPLQMNDTYFFVPKEKLNRLSAVYKFNDSKSLVKFRKMGQEEKPSQFYSGGGGLRTTVEDYFKFAQCLLNGGELNGVRILSPKSVELMTTNQIEGGIFGEEWGWGLGAEIQLKLTDGRLGSVGAFGWNGGTGTRYVVDPKEKLIIIIFAPSTPRNSAVNRLRDQFVNSAYQAIIKSYH